jgi:hypothetical protein
VNKVEVFKDVDVTYIFFFEREEGRHSTNYDLRKEIELVIKKFPT